MAERDLSPAPGRTAGTTSLHRGAALSPRLRVTLLVLLALIVLFLGLVAFTTVL